MKGDKIGDAIFQIMHLATPNVSYFLYCDISFDRQCLYAHHHNVTKHVYLLQVAVVISPNRYAFCWRLQTALLKNGEGAELID